MNFGGMPKFATRQYCASIHSVMKPVFTVSQRPGTARGGQLHGDYTGISKTCDFTASDPPGLASSHEAKKRKPRLEAVASGGRERSSLEIYFKVQLDVTLMRVHFWCSNPGPRKTKSQALLVGFGFGLRNVKPKPDEAKPKPGLPTRPRRHHQKREEMLKLYKPNKALKSLQGSTSLVVNASSEPSTWDCSAAATSHPLLDTLGLDLRNKYRLKFLLFTVGVLQKAGAGDGQRHTRRSCKAGESDGRYGRTASQKQERGEEREKNLKDEGRVEKAQEAKRTHIPLASVEFADAAMKTEKED
ncbi:hypothetical protein B0H13DRAFT_1919341 [Mycena leptocephala]|nr:hypothetical protein B0H13DRAFT_1919341 [Mycena leptocephala]